MALFIVLHYQVCDVDNLFIFILAYQCIRNLPGISKGTQLWLATRIFVYELETLFENMAYNAVYQILTGYRYNVCNIKTFLSDIGTNIFS